ncbi:MAG: dihydrodipicolinate synthase family protein [Pirellulaceae bacterium]
MKSIEGVVPIVHTPFDDQDQIDWESFERQVAWAVECGIQGCAIGMVSEVMWLSSSERQQLTENLVSAVSGRVFTIASAGAENTGQAIEYASHAEKAGCDAVMAIPPVHTPLQDEEVFNYFRQIAGAVEIPVIVQDASSYVGQPIDLSVYTRLIDEFGAERIYFKPESSPLGPNLSRLRDATEGQARVFEGSGGISLVDSYHRGIRGTMPGMEFLEGIVAIWEALERGDESTAYRVYLPVCALVALQLQAGLDGFLEIEKYVLKKRGLFATDHRRGPISWQLDEETREEVDRLFCLLEVALES